MKQNERTGLFVGRGEALFNTLRYEIGSLSSPWVIIPQNHCDGRSSRGMLQFLGGLRFSWDKLQGCGGTQESTTADWSASTPRFLLQHAIRPPACLPAYRLIVIEKCLVLKGWTWWTDSYPHCTIRGICKVFVMLVVHILQISCGFNPSQQPCLTIITRESTLAICKNITRKNKSPNPHSPDSSSHLHTGVGVW